MTPSDDTPRADASPVVWDADGRPVSRAFGDIYFSRQDGLAEARTVFLGGCGLPAAFEARSRFVVGELGFGSGLNILALLDAWLKAAPTEALLSVFTVEAHLMPKADAARALSAWPELAPLAADLLAQWPGRARGFHRLDLAGGRARVDLAQMDAAEALAGWTGAADAWFLDGFAPSLNPGMWSERVLAGVAAHAAPGAAAATYTVAGSVRRGLAAAGFAVTKAKGHGVKRERLEARFPGERAAPPTPRSAIVVGAGAAGAALTWAFRAEGIEVTVIADAAPGAGASGNRAGLVTPRFDVGGGPAGAFYAQALRRAGALYRRAGDAVIAEGVVQVARSEAEAVRFERLAQSPDFGPGRLRRLDAAAAEARLGEAAPHGGLEIADALVIRPRAVLAACLAGARVIRAGVARLAPAAGGGVEALDADGAPIARADVAVIAAGLSSETLCGELDLRPVRGQISFAPDAGPVCAAVGGAYVAQADGGIVFGATHDRGDRSEEVRGEDDARNLARLAELRPALAAALSRGPLEGRAGVRAATRDQLPHAGRCAALREVFVLTGLGSRGFCSAPLLAEHIVALAVGAPSPLPAQIADLFDPARFAS